MKAVNKITVILENFLDGKLSGDSFAVKFEDEMFDNDKALADLPFYNQLNRLVDVAALFDRYHPNGGNGYTSLRQLLEAARGALETLKEFSHKRAA